MLEYYTPDYWTTSSTNTYCKRFIWFRICWSGDSKRSVRPKCCKNEIVSGYDGPYVVCQWKLWSWLILNSLSVRLQWKCSVEMFENEIFVRRWFCGKYLIDTCWRIAPLTGRFVPATVSTQCIPNFSKWIRILRFFPSMHMSRSRSFLFPVFDDV